MADTKHTIRCAFCRRQLHYEISKRAGVVPHCAKEHGIERDPPETRAIGEGTRK
jgi:hypothetical protein